MRATWFVVGNFCFWCSSTSSLEGVDLLRAARIAARIGWVWHGIPGVGHAEQYASYTIPYFFLSRSVCYFVWALSTRTVQTRVQFSRRELLQGLKELDALEIDGKTYANSN